MTKLLTSEDNIDTDDPTINSHSETLKRHLATFNLQLDRVQSDGDCAFRTIMRQVRKLVHNEAGQLSEHLRRLGLLNTEDLDTYTLRQLFVDAVLADDYSISNFVDGSQADVERKGREFSVRGFFDHEFDDFVYCHRVNRSRVCMSKQDKHGIQNTRVYMGKQNIAEYNRVFNSTRYTWVNRRFNNYSTSARMR